MSTPCWSSFASTTSANEAPRSDVFNSVRRACWASMARSCSTGPAYRSTRSTGTPAMRATSSADSPDRIRAWMSRGASEGGSSARIIGVGPPALRSVRMATETRSSMGSVKQPADLVGEHQCLAVLGEGDEAYRPHVELPPYDESHARRGPTRLATRYAEVRPNGRSARRRLQNVPTRLRSWCRRLSGIPRAIPCLPSYGRKRATVVAAHDGRRSWRSRYGRWSPRTA